MRRRSRVTKFAAGILGVVFLAIVSYLVFGGSLPFSGTAYQLSGWPLSTCLMKPWKIGAAPTMPLTLCIGV